MILDTTVLIDLQKESRREQQVRASGEPIGDHDLWIAALALRHGRTVVSRKQRHFRSVPGLSFRAY